MRDGLNEFGNLSLATKDVKVFSTSIDLGDPSAKYSKHHNRGGASVCFRNTAALETIDSYIPILQDSADDTTFDDLVTGPQTAAGLALGKTVRIPFPHDHRRYVRAAVVPKSTGTFTAKTVEAEIEFGPNVDPL